jgi:TetR/AcrR family transcriptional regulator
MVELSDRVNFNSISQHFNLDIRTKGERKMGKVGLAAKSLNISPRERLLAAAAELFSRKGYSATTTREIVAIAGVTKPVLYYYFRNKEGIYLDLMHKATNKFEAMLDAFHAETGTPKKRILSFCDQIFALILENIEILRLVYSIYYGPHQGAPFIDFDSFELKLQKTVKQLVQEGIKKKEFQKEYLEDMTWAILGTLNSSIEIELSHPEWGFGRKGLKRVLNLIFRGILARDGKKKGERK